MITSATEKLIVETCRRLCETLQLEQVYLAQIIGARRHHIAGYGCPAFGKPNQIQLTYTLTVFWHGVLPTEKESYFIRTLCALTDRIEKEIAVDKKRQYPTYTAINPKEN